MNYAWRLWIGFAMVLTVLLVATAFMSVTALRLDRAEALAKQQAAIEERVRLALWRMDSALAPLLAQENAHPRYRDKAPSPTAATDRRDHTLHGELQNWSAGTNDEYVLLRFHYRVDSSADAAQSHDQLAGRIPRKQLLEKLPDAPSDPPVTLRVGAAESSRQATNRSRGDTIASRSAVEFQQRNQSLINNSIMAQQLSSPKEIGADAIPGMMTPVWESGEMVLARRIQRDGAEYVQGCLIDWNAMQEWLLGMVEDLLPDARLEPLGSFDATGEPGLLAALPVRLLPGPLPTALQQRPSAVPQTLALAWFAVLLSSLVGAVLLVGVVRLSQRRAAFVAAVTHELRTPLTTFRMYSEMLAQGMVQDPGVQREYLHTLRDQSLRLSHLVENVLAYARLERGRGIRCPEEIPLGQLIDPILPSLAQLAASEKMELVVERTMESDVPVRANRSAVEQILVNLIDNACKYAGGTADRRICLSAFREGRYAVLRVRDYGPGMPHKRRGFRPFGKSVQEAARSAPGIGLGLALSRRLAEQMGGRLDVDRTVTDGAALLLRLRCV